MSSARKTVRASKPSGPRKLNSTVFEEVTGRALVVQQVPAPPSDDSGWEPAEVTGAELYGAPEDEENIDHFAETEPRPLTWRGALYLVEELMRHALVGEVAAQRESATPRARDEFAGRIGRARVAVRGDVRARFGERDRNRRAETCGRARDERDFVVQSELVENHLRLN